MKKILGFVIAIGFVVMVGAAGSVEYVNMGFFKALLLEAVGIITVLCGISALMHYNVYTRRTRRRRVSDRARVATKIRVAKQIKIPEKELC